MNFQGNGNLALTHYSGLLLEVNFWPQSQILGVSRNPEPRVPPWGSKVQRVTSIFVMHHIMLQVCLKCLHPPGTNCELVMTGTVVFLCESPTAA